MAVLVAKRPLVTDEWSVVLPLLLFNGATGDVSLEGPPSSVSDHVRLLHENPLGGSDPDSWYVVIVAKENRVSSASELLEI